ncbi:MAG: acyltransferase [Verrucomicrobiota bacterium]
MAKRLRDKFCSLLFANTFYRFGSRSVICLPVRLYGEAAIEIGSQVYLGTNCWLEVMNLDSSTSKPVLSIGDQTSISGSCTITAISRVNIGRSVLIAQSVYISDHSHACASSVVPIKDQGVTKIAPVTICDGAWIGYGAVILPGVTIGRNSVVGANSVVRESVPDLCVAVGSPARIIRRPKPSCFQ